MRLQDQAQEKQPTFRTDFLELRSTRLQLLRETEVTHLQHGLNLLTWVETSSYSVRPAKVSITVSVTADSSIRRTGVLTLMAPQTSTAILPTMRTDGFTPHGLMTQPLTLVRFTLMVNLTGRVKSVLRKEVVQLSSVDVTAEKLVTEASLMKSASGTLLFRLETLLTSLPDKPLLK